MSDVQTTVRMPADLHERLAREASETRVPQNTIMINAIRDELDRRDDRRPERSR